LTNRAGLVDFIAFIFCLAIDPGTSRTRWKLWTFACAWRRSTSIFAKELEKCSSCATRSRAKCRNRVQQSSASITLGREQMKAIQKELGEQDEGQRDVED